MLRMKLLFTLVAAVVLSATAHRASAQTTCTNTSLTGSYGFTATGSLSAGDPIAVVGTFTFDGAGGATMMFTLSQNGVILQNVPASGNYSINTNCSGTITIANVFNLNFVLDDKNELRAVDTDQGAVVTLTAKKQQPTT